VNTSGGTRSRTELASSGLPQGLELEILESVRDLVPPEVFTTVYENPVGGTPEAVRANLGRAIALFGEAGWTVGPDNLMRNAAGEALTIEFVDNDPNSERYVLPYQQALERIGVKLTIRILDTPQLVERMRTYDYDMTTELWGQSLSPGNEQLYFWGSESVDEEGGRNTAGISDPGVDKLIERVIFAANREELIAATRALDRVLLWHHYVIPQWYIDYARIARWDRFARPETLPKYSFGFPTVWWWDAEKAAAVGARQ